MKNISTSEPCIITASRIEENLNALLPQVLYAYYKKQQFTGVLKNSCSVKIVKFTNKTRVT